jgi:hypothetical protein
VTKAATVARKLLLLRLPSLALGPAAMTTAAVVVEIVMALKVVQVEETSQAVCVP